MYSVYRHDITMSFVILGTLYHIESFRKCRHCQSPNFSIYTHLYTYDIFHLERYKCTEMF